MSAALARDRAQPVIRVAAPADGAGEGEKYIAAHRDGTVFHRAGWARAVAAAYGYERIMLLAERAGAVVGCLPLIDVRAPLLGRSLVSTAFSVGGGVLADDEETARSLCEAAAAVARERGAKYVELRAPAPYAPGWREKTGVYASFALALPEGEDENLAAIPRKRRAEIRKAESLAESGALDVRCIHDVDLFYALYADAMRDHGTPVFPKRFVETLVAEYRDDVDISIAEHHGAPVAALLSFYDKQWVRPYYIGAVPAARACGAAEWLYWRQMRRAAHRGATQFDFGRSKIGAGAFSFKKHWGAAPTPVTYAINLAPGAAMPDINPQNQKFATLVSLWKRLPAPAARRLGPMIAGNFP